MSMNTPWRIDRDNEQGITIVDDRGNLVWSEEWADAYAEGIACGGDQIVRDNRARAHAAVRAVNAHDDLVKALRGFLLGCGADERALAEVVGEDVVRDAHEILSRIKTEG